MPATGFLKHGLGSRFALRTYLLFCLCALVPVGIFGAIGYVVVTGELRSNAAEQLTWASKQYGLLVNERLIQAEKALADLAHAQMSGAAIAEATTYSDTRLDNISMRELTLLAREDGSVGEAHSSIVPTLQITAAEQPAVLMQVTVHKGARAISATGELRPSELWDTDAVALAGMSLCISAARRQLNCSSSDAGTTDPGAGQSLRESWTLFLKPRYGVPEWTIQASQPVSIALQGLHTFQILLVSTAALAGFGALLVSAVQIRRSHRPLAQLIEAARQMGSSRFDTRVKLKGSGEFAHLGRAFNHLAAGLQRQFRVLRAFSRIDRQILASSDVEPLIRALLPRMSRLLRAQMVMLAVKDVDAAAASLYFCRAGNLSAMSLQTIDGSRLDAMLEQPGPQWLSDSSHEVDQALDWKSSSILVKGTLRGVIAIGRAPRPRRQDDDRHLLGLARRFAVALTNQDRERELLRQAYYDALTALPNRQLFKDRLAQELLRCQRDGGSVSLFFIDLDHFKNVNDSLGHSAGDELLRAASTRLQLLLRSGDTLARLGGDEFTLITPDLDDVAAESLAQRMIEAMSQPFDLGGTQCVVQASIGIAVYPRDSDTAEDLVRSADTAMYRAKAQGRGRAIFFEEAMNARVVRRHALEQSLRQAIADGSLSLHYQPKFTAADRSLAGVEALARWDDPVHGPISPSEFIPLAEECGLMEALGTWCLREACVAMRSWRSMGLAIAHVAVNVSMQQLRNAGFRQLLEDALLDHGLQPCDLTIEVTESMLAGDLREVVTLLNAVQRLGVRVAIDDFGTGYSSMVALQQLPADIVKIDRAFVTDCQTPQGLALLRALIAAGHALGKEVVAEGVETEQQLAILRACRCDGVQGYLLGKPQSKERLESRLLGERTLAKAMAG